MLKRASKSYLKEIKINRRITNFEVGAKVLKCTYLSGWDQDSNLFACLGELVGLDRAVVVQVKVLKVLE